MKKVSLWKALALLIPALAVVFTLTAWAGSINGGDDGGSQVLEPEPDLPRPGDCICPQVYDPVICRKQLPDGTIVRQKFPNGCVAGCNGFTSCASASNSITPVGG